MRTDSIVEMEAFPSIYKLTRKNTKRPLIVIPHEDHARPATKWMTIFKPLFKTNIPQIEVRIITGITTKNLAAVTFFRGTANVSAWRMWQVIKRFKDRGATDEQIAELAGMKKPRVIDEYSAIEKMDQRLWSNGRIVPGKKYPTIMDVRVLKFVAKRRQRKVWSLVKQIKDGVLRMKVIRLIVDHLTINVKKRTGFRPRAARMVPMPTQEEVLQMYTSIREKSKKKLRLVHIGPPPAAFQSRWDFYFTKFSERKFSA